MMIHCRNLILLAFSIFSAALPALAQEKFRAVHWGVEEKMAVAPAFGMIKDVNGFLWIGTRDAGLIRFDGSVFKNYFHENNNNSISGNDIRGLIEDSLHNIWFGTENGLSRYDINGDSFRTIAHVPSTLPADRAFIPFWATKDEVFVWDYPDMQWAAFNIHTSGKKNIRGKNFPLPILENGRPTGILFLMPDPIAFGLSMETREDQEVDCYRCRSPPARNCPLTGTALEIYPMMTTHLRACITIIKEMPSGSIAQTASWSSR